ncbi:MAG: nucleotidyltransferase domain-containing protein [Treponema sp.]|jgi:predicted nucleotidyltransferase|nr:nucleotidyltransferase domain-containing protein [Treponema sp.]
MVVKVSKKKTPSYSSDMAFVISTILESVADNYIKKIILFGSYAYGKPGKNSDIDICIIIADKINSRDIYLKIALALFNKKIISTDLLVYREKDFITGIQKNEKGIESVINSNGRVLYAPK